ncbi:MAG: oligosaccharide flippase family protein [Saprospiraceae bacterium]|nr:oligosaccharide flippase family protein [Saprospiraceae bacterium]
MKELIRFIKEFVRNNGLFVFSAILISKVSLLAINIIAARWISIEDYGMVSLVFSTFAIFAPLTGWGSYQGLLRYGVLEQDQFSKDRLSRYVLKKGFFNHLSIVLLFVIASYLYTLKYGNIVLIIALFGVRLLGYYFQNFLESYYRICYDNRTFSWITILTGLGGLLLTIIGIHYWGLLGYLMAMALMPWLSMIFMKKHLIQAGSSTLSLNLNEFRSYSIHAGITYFISDILFSMDFLLIGFLLNEDSLAYYKTAIILPMNLAILPQIFVQTDYPKLAQNFKNKQYLSYYIKNYYKIFIPLGCLILLVGYLIKDDIIPLVFGRQYQGEGAVFFIMLIFMVGNMWMRNLYGNLTSAIGKANWNTYVSVGAVLIILALGLWLIPLLGIKGAAIGMGVAFTFTGITTMILIHRYIRNL